MEIHWKASLKKKLEKLAKSDRQILKRLNSIKAAFNFKDIMPQCNGRAHFLKGDLKGFFQ